ncbi:MAG: hypothetical protein ABS901_00525 [Candidatus Limivicinus sp.]
MKKKDRKRIKACIRKLYDLGSRLEIAAERAIVALIKKKKKR